MSAATLRHAATILRERAATEATLRDGDPYYAKEALPNGQWVSEASQWDLTASPSLGLLIADCLDTEAQMLDMLEPFTELLSATVEAQGGPKGALRLLKDDQGDPILTTDTTPSWVRVAEAIIEGAQS